MRRHVSALLLLAGGTTGIACHHDARAQGLDMSQGGQVSVTAAGGFDWDQNSQTVTAYDRAQAVRGNVTVRADRLIAYYRKKNPTAHPAQSVPPSASATGNAPAALQAATRQEAPVPAATATPAPSPATQSQATQSAAQSQAADAVPDASIQAPRTPLAKPGAASTPSSQPATRSTAQAATNKPAPSPAAANPPPAPVPAAPPSPTARGPAPPTTTAAAGGDPDVDTSLATHSDTLPEDLPPPDRPMPQSSGHAAGPGGEGSGGNGGSEVYRLEAVGHVHIFTNTDQAWGDRAVYDMDQAVLVMTGTNMKMTTPQDILTARDTMEYHSREHMSVSRGNATLTTNDGRQMRADILVGYDRPKNSRTPRSTTGHDASPGAGAIDRVDAFGHILIRTQSEAVTGDRGVYVPDSAIARIVGNVHISRGLNQISGAAAIVNMRTGIATLTDTPGSRVSGLVVPNQAGNGNKGTTK
ncbi:hypothetical protein [Novacetimonas pomaceti]|uniref:Organic solvent tolerance-like N-terminal domain-containing protein n=1 Tax=Novacetimonas pomaceti TaxID=2021998 RepID=A0ABX5P509_9PROT|nr:hypothetical protein [Novacetimonas pomaceti]PYD48863.1 hypothetical protein C3920_02500 [Novacetimonas pomaceti]